VAAIIIAYATMRAYLVGKNRGRQSSGKEEAASFRKK